MGGVWSFTSAPGVSGPVVVNYSITDNDGGTDSAVHTINVGNQPPVLTDPDPTPGTPSIDPGNPTNLLVPAVDNVPVAVDLDNYFTDPNTGDTLTITPNLTGLPGWVTYDPVTHILGGTPPVDNAGPVVVPVTVDDGHGGSFTGSITITPVNPGPDAVDDSQAVLPGVATPLTLLANDTDPDGDPLSVTTATLANPALGTLTNVGGVWSFTSAPGVSGPVVVNYSITDNDGGTDSAVHTINVGNQPDVPLPPPPPEPEPLVPAPVDVTRPSVTPLLSATPPAPLPVATGPALHVLYAVGAVSGESSLGATAGLAALQASSPLLAEAAGRTPDALMFIQSDPYQDLRLMREPLPGEVIEMRPALHVQHAVRHQPVTMEQGLFVQHAVRSSQLDAQLMDAALNSQNSASLGDSTLFDPFALGALGSDALGIQAARVAEAESSAKPAESMADKAVVGDHKAAGNGVQPRTGERVEVKRSAAGFKAQLEGFAKDRSHGARPITRTNAKI